jgi:hypothetical protein
MRPRWSDVPSYTYNDASTGIYNEWVPGTMPKGTSNISFWQWFDGLPKAERDRCNAARDGQEFMRLRQRAMALHPPT